MPNGKPDDSPDTDVVTHSRGVYTPEIADRIRELDPLGAVIDVHDVLAAYGLDPDADDRDAMAADRREPKREYESAD